VPVREVVLLADKREQLRHYAAGAAAMSGGALSHHARQLARRGTRVELRQLPVADYLWVARRLYVCEMWMLCVCQREGCTHVSARLCGAVGTSQRRRSWCTCC